MTVGYRNLNPPFPAGRVKPRRRLPQIPTSSSPRLSLWQISVALFVGTGREITKAVVAETSVLQYDAVDRCHYPPLSSNPVRYRPTPAAAS